jgi:hypothetical protein
VGKKNRSSSEGVAQNLREWPCSPSILAAFRAQSQGGGAFCWLAYRSCGRRQVNFERRAYGAYTLDGNVAAVLLEDSVDHRQAQSSALSYALSGEKWLKDTRLHLWHHPGASAADD